MLEVTSSADSCDLVELNVVEAALGLTGAGEGRKLALLITQASAAVAAECNRVLALETVTETFRLQRRTREVFLSRYPVTEIVSVTEDGEAVEPGEYELDSTANTVARLCNDTKSFWSASKIVVTYTAGYDVDDVPADLQRAVIALVGYYRCAADPLLRSVAIDGVSTRTYADFTPGSGLPPEVLGLIENHRKPSIG